MDLFDAEMLAKELMSRYVPDYRLDWMNKKNVYGSCHYSIKTIMLSRPLTKICTPEVVSKTIMHEIAHALTPGAGHGYLWKMQMARFGLPADRCVKVGTVDRSSISNWEATCSNCNSKYHMIRKPRQDKACKTCCDKYNRGYYSKVFQLTYTRI